MTNYFKILFTIAIITLFYLSCSNTDMESISGQVKKETVYGSLTISAPDRITPSKYIKAGEITNAKATVKGFDGGVAFLPITKLGISVTNGITDTFTITGIPVGTNRVLCIEDIDSALKIYSLVNITAGTNYGIINKNTSALGRLYVELISRNKTTTVGEDTFLSTYIDGLKAVAGYYTFINYSKLADDFIAGSLTAATPYNTYILSTYTVKFSIPVDIDVDKEYFALVTDPASAKKTIIVKGENLITGISPGTYRLKVQYNGKLHSFHVDTTVAIDGVIDIGTAFNLITPYSDYSSSDIITTDSLINLYSSEDAAISYSLDNTTWISYSVPFKLTAGTQTIYLKAVLYGITKESSVTLNVVAGGKYSIVGTFTDWANGPKLPIEMTYDSVNNLFYADVSMGYLGNISWVSGDVLGANASFKIRHTDTYNVQFAGETKKLILLDTETSVARTLTGENLHNLYTTVEKYGIYHFELKIDSAGENHTVKISKTGMMNVSVTTLGMTLIGDDASLFKLAMGDRTTISSIVQSSPAVWTFDFTQDEKDIIVDAFIDANNNNVMDASELSVGSWFTLTKGIENSKSITLGKSEINVTVSGNTGLFSKPMLVHNYIQNGSSSTVVAPFENGSFSTYGDLTGKYGAGGNLSAFDDLNGNNLYNYDEPIITDGQMISWSYAPVKNISIAIPTILDFNGKILDSDNAGEFSSLLTETTNSFIAYSGNNELKFMKSTDSGAMWSAPISVSAEQADQINLLRISGNLCIVYKNSSYIKTAISNDEGSTWQTYSTSAIGASDMKATCDGTKLYIFYSENYIFKMLSSSDPADCGTPQILKTETEYFDAISTTAGNGRIYAAYRLWDSQNGTNRYFVTADQGATIDEYEYPALHYPMGRSLVARDDMLYMVSGNDYEFASSEDHGKTWNQISSSSPESGVGITGCSLAYNGSQFYLTAIDTWKNKTLRLYKSVDGADNSWSVLELDKYVNCSDREYGPSMTVNGNNLMISYYNYLQKKLMLIRSTDNGVTWQE